MTDWNLKAWLKGTRWQFSAAVGIRWLVPELIWWGRIVKDSDIINKKVNRTCRTI